MNRYLLAMIFSACIFWTCRQKSPDISVAENDKTLLWKISGNGLEKPSYLYGTVHILCSEKAGLSANFKRAIRETDEVYFEIDMDDLGGLILSEEMMLMKNDTSLDNLLTQEDLVKVRSYVNDKSIFAFGDIKKYKPILISTMLFEGLLSCKEKTGMEEVIMKEAKKNRKPILGMETLKFQLDILDSVPYQMQAKSLVSFVDSARDEAGMKTYMGKIDQTYFEQDLPELERSLAAMDPIVEEFADVLLYNRNKKWVVKFKTMTPGKSRLIAVGAGHLPGKQGLISLIRKEGYTVTPMENILPANGK